MRFLIMPAALVVVTPALARSGVSYAAVDRPVPCVLAADVPTPPAPLSPRPTDARAALDLAVAKVFEYLGYTEKADALLQSCAR